MHTSLRWRMFLVVAATFLAAQAPAQPRFTFDATPGQLGKDVVPSEYRLALDLDPAKATFTGVVDIALKVRRPVEGIVLNAFELTAGDIALTGPGGARPMTATDDKTKRQWRIADGRTIEPGEYTLRIAYTGNVNTVGRGAVRRCLHGRGQARADARDAAGTHRRALGLSGIRRAVVSRELRDHGHRAVGLRSRLQHAGQVARRAGCGDALAICADAADADLSRGGRGRAVRRARRQRGRHSAAHPDGKGQEGGRALRDGRHQEGAAVLPRVLRRPLRAAQARPDRRPRRPQRRDGRLGPHLLQRARPALRSRKELDRDQAGCLRGDRARNRAPVVRQPGDGGVLGRDLAQRSVRDVDGEQGHGAVQPGLADSAQPRAHAPAGDAWRRRSGDARDTVRACLRNRGVRRVRRRHLHQGRRGAGDGRDVHRTRRVPARTRRVLRRTEAVQRNGRRSLALPVAGVRNGCRGRRAELDRPEGLPVAAGARHLRKRQADARTRAATLQRRRRRRHDEPVAGAVRGFGRHGARPLRFLLGRPQREIRDRAVHDGAVVHRLVGRFLPCPVSARTPAPSDTRVSGALALRAPRAADRYVRAGSGRANSARRIFRSPEPAASGQRSGHAGPVPAGRLCAVEPQRRDVRHAGARGRCTATHEASWGRCWVSWAGASPRPTPPSR